LRTPNSTSIHNRESTNRFRSNLVWHHELGQFDRLHNQPDGASRGVRLAFEVVRVSPPIISRLRLGCLRRSPPAVFRFRCGSRVFRPTHVGSFPKPTSASSPSPRVRRARRGTGPPAIRAPRERGPADLAWPCLPRTRSFGVPSSGLSAAVHSRHTPLGHDTSSRPRATGLRAVAATPRRSCSALVVSHHLDGLLRTAGSGLVASRYRTWGSLRFTTARRRAPKCSRRAAGRPRSRRRGGRPGFSQR
jgi:hypothetical protein